MKTLQLTKYPNRKRICIEVFDDKTNNCTIVGFLSNDYYKDLFMEALTSKVYKLKKNKKEKPKENKNVYLTYNENKFLKKCQDKFDYIFRIKKGNIVLCKNKPKKVDLGWTFAGNWVLCKEVDSMFKFIEHCDEPYSIKELLKN